MPTGFSSIYDRAVFKFTDYTFLTTAAEIKKDVLWRYLQSAIVDFAPCYSEGELTYDLEKEEFTADLSDEVQEILALGIAYYWLSGQALTRSLLKNILHNKDYTSYSPANLLKEIQSLKDGLDKEYRGKINTYSVRHGNIQDLKT